LFTFPYHAWWYITDKRSGLFKEGVGERIVESKHMNRIKNPVAGAVIRLLKATLLI
jgi:hypothetical protein